MKKENPRAGRVAKEPAAPRPYRVQPLALGGALHGLNIDKAWQVSAELEDEEIARKHPLANPPA